jgi:hypothetical protein
LCLKNLSIGPVAYFGVVRFYYLFPNNPKPLFYLNEEGILKYCLVVDYDSVLNPEALQIQSLIAEVVAPLFNKVAASFKTLSCTSV